MKIDIQKISEGDEKIILRYRILTPQIKKIIEILEGETSDFGNKADPGVDVKLWGKMDSEVVCVNPRDLLYLESVDDKLFAYTGDSVLKIDGSLNSFMTDMNDESFFRCSKSMVINVNRVKALKSMSSNRIDATMEGGEHIIISRRYASAFRRLLKGER